MHNRTVARVGTAARQTVAVVAVRFQIIAPCFAPEGGGDGAAGNFYRGYLLPVLGQLLQPAHRLGPPLSHGNIRSKTPPGHVMLLAPDCRKAAPGRPIRSRPGRHAPAPQPAPP